MHTILFHTIKSYSNPDTILGEEQALTVLRPEDLVELFGIRLEETDCAGIRLHLDQVYSLESNGRLGVSGRKLPEYHEIKAHSNIYRLGPGPYYVKYREWIEIPNGFIGLAIQRSSLIRMGATLYTAVWDPGYKGRGSGLLVVHNPHGIEIERGAQIAQLVFFKMTGTTRRTYNGYYQGEK